MKKYILLFLLFLIPTLVAAQTTPRWVQISEKELSQAAITRLGSSTMTLLFNRPATITEDITIPSNVKLKFDCAGSLNIATGKTLTINSSIDAPHIQIFTGAGTVTCTRRVGATPASQRYSGSIKPAWWGAKNDGVYPTSGADGTAGTGTDSSAAFRAAALFAYNANAAFPENGGMSVCPIECEPGAVYLVTGDNVLGVTTDSTYWTNYKVEGNGCSFLWTPTLVADTFIGNGHVLKNAHFKDFAVWVHGFTGAKGIFWDGSAFWTGSEWSTGCQRNLFENLQIGKTRNNTPTVTTRLSKVFYSTGNFLGDRIEVTHCFIRDADTFVYIENPNAVSWKFRNSSIYSKTDNTVFFNFVGNYGGFHVTDCDLIMGGNNQTLIKTDNQQALIGGYDPSTTNFWSQDFSITHSRLETTNIATYSFVLADVKFGQVLISNINTATGGGGDAATSYLAKVASEGSVIFRDCPRLLGKIQIAPRTSLTQLLLQPIGVTVDNCGLNLQRADGVEVAVGGSFYGLRAAIQALVTPLLPAVIIRNLIGNAEKYPNEIQGTSWQFGNAPGETNYTRVRLGKHNTVSNGNSYLWDASTPYAPVLPPYSIVTSLKVFNGPPSGLYGCSVTIGSYSVEVPFTLSGGTYGTELIGSDSAGIYVASALKQRQVAFMGLSSTGVATTTQIPAWAELTFRGISTKSDIPTANVESSQILIP